MSRRFEGVTRPDARMSGPGLLRVPVPASGVPDLWHAGTFDFAKFPAKYPVNGETRCAKQGPRGDGWKAVYAESKVKPRAVSLTRDPERTRAVILRAATAEITAKGLTGARVDAIAERAGVNKRMLYHYFGDKQGLYLAVLEATYAAIRAAEIGLNLTELDPAAGMRRLVLFTWQYFIDHPEFLSLLVTENMN